ncbi:MAG: histidine kinase [Actinobacteria bacterium]|nr:histidine kinase [Actinomycetota bacterium]
MSALVQRHRCALIDLAVTAVALWLTLAQYGSRGFGEYHETATAPDALGFLLVLATALPLLVRRRHPWPVFAATLAGSVALLGFGYGVHAPVAVVFSLFTLARDPNRAERSWWTVLAAALGAFAAIVVAESLALSANPGNYVFLALILAAALFVGDKARTRRQRRTEARDRRRREQQLAIADERTRLARELHDSAGHAINTILVQAGAARVLRDSDPERSRAAVDAIESLARETIDDIDRIVGALREDGPAARSPTPGVERIGDLVATQRLAGVEVTLRESGEGEPPAAIGRAAYRIAQEALTNAARHGAGPVEIVLERGPEAVLLTVVNPVGANGGTRPGGGLGIVGMRERATLAGGSLEAAREGDRFRLRAVLPYDREP